MSFRINFILPPTRKPFVPPKITPPKGLKPPGGLGGGALGGALGYILNELINPRPTSPAALSEIDPSLYKPRDDVDSEVAQPPGWFGGQQPGVFYRLIYNQAVISNGTLSSWTITNGSNNAGLIGPLSNVRLYANGQLLGGMRHWGFRQSGMVPVFGDNTRPYRVEVINANGDNIVALSNGSSGIEILGFVPQSTGVPDQTMPPLVGGSSQSAPPNPLPPLRDEPPFTNEEFFNKYGAPPRLKPFKPPVPPEIEEERKVAPLEFGEFFPDTPVFDLPSRPPVSDPGKDSVKPGVAPGTYKKITTKPGGSTNTTTNFRPLPSEKKITIKEPYIFPSPNNPTTPSPQPQPQPERDFEEDVRRKLEEIYQQTTEIEQKKYTESAICTSFLSGCSKPVLDKLDDLLEGEDDISCEPELTEIEVVVGSCSSDGSAVWTEETVTLEVPSSQSVYISKIFEQQKALGKQLCELDPNIPLPQDWRAKRTTLPQQIQVVLINDNGSSKTYHKICVPHPASVEATTSSFIPPYTKGNWYGQLFYNDGSRFTVYASTKEEAERVINHVLALVNSSFVNEPPRLSFGERRGMPVGTGQMTPIKQYFYDGVQLNGKPSWMRYISASGE